MDRLPGLDGVVDLVVRAADRVRVDRGGLDAAQTRQHVARELLFAGLELQHLLFDLLLFSQQFDEAQRLNGTGASLAFNAAEQARFEGCDSCDLLVDPLRDAVAPVLFFGVGEWHLDSPFVGDLDR